MKKCFIAITVIGLGILGVSCNNDDNNIVNTPHSLKYSNNSDITYNISIDYFTEGSTKVPTINWGDGKTGTFTLDKSYKGLSINKDNGVISWTKEFLEGYADLKVTAKNSLGSISKYIVITTKFKNQFKGKYNTDIKSTTLDKDIFITMVDSKNGKISITESGKTKIIEVNLEIKEGKLSFNDKDFSPDLPIGKVWYSLTLTPIKNKSNFEGTFHKVTNNNKTIIKGKINLENL